jgi:predicted DNA-binding transcriptional regulator AlpA
MYTQGVVTQGTLTVRNRQGERRGTRMPTNPQIDQLLTGREVAAILKLTPQTVIEWRRENRGPRWVRIGQRAIRYRRSELEAWIAEGEAP